VILVGWRGNVSRQPPPEHRLRRRLAVGRLIRDVRIRGNRTQERLGEAAGIDRQTINRIENGHSTPTVDQLLDIAEALGVSPRDLLPEQVPQAPPE
jgi:transcriptional regulator with XRE-family HTH domain